MTMPEWTKSKTKTPAFYCMKTLMGYHPGPDLNRITLYGPNDFSFELIPIGKDRDPNANQRCNELAAKLTELWEKEIGNTSKTT